MERDILIALIAYCQNNGVLPTDSSVCEVLADIAECDVSFINEIMEV